MTARLSVRPAGGEDTAAVVALVQDAYRGSGGPGRWTTEAHLVTGRRTSPAEVDAHIAAERSVVLVAEDADGLLACCHVKALPGGPGRGEGEAEGERAYFGMFAVRPGRQGLGVGRLMLARAELWAREHWGVTVMEMQVIDGRDELLAWYDRLGYRRTGRTIAFPVDQQDDVPIVAGLRFVVLEKRLSP